MGCVQAQLLDEVVRVPVVELNGPTLSSDFDYTLQEVSLLHVILVQANELSLLDKETLVELVPDHDDSSPFTCN